MLKLIRDSVGMLLNTVEDQPVLLDHNTSTILVNIEVLNEMCDHTRVGHVTGRCGGVTVSQQKKRAEKNEQQQRKASGIQKQLNLKQWVWC